MMKWQHNMYIQCTSVNPHCTSILFEFWHVIHIVQFIIQIHWWYITVVFEIILVSLALLSWLLSDRLLKHKLFVFTVSWHGCQQVTITIYFHTVNTWRNRERLRTSSSRMHPIHSHYAAPIHKKTFESVSSVLSSGGAGPQAPMRRLH